MKWCNSCETVKPDEAFWKDSSQPKGLRSHCVECVQSKSQADYMHGYYKYVTKPKRAAARAAKAAQSIAQEGE